MSVSRRLAAILAADVVGYSRLMEADEASTLTALKARRRDVLEPLVGKHQGRVFKVTGDGVLVEFGSAVNAVQCAVELQQAFASANATLPEVRQIVLRIGVNLGDVMVEGGDLYGDGVNIAARLEAMADPGGIVVSGTAYDYVRNKVKVGFEDLGAQALKNIADPVRSYRAMGTPAVVAAVPKPASDKPSIAILPFTNMSGDSEQEYFSDGITDDIITDLSRFRSLLVIARNSSFQYKGKNVDVRRVARELNVQYVVEGSIRKAGGSIRITAQLVDSILGSHLWAERYDRSLDDIFAVQNEVVRAIVSALPVRLSDVAIDRSRRLPTQNLTAFDYLLRARWALWHTTGDKQASFDWLEKALRLDPNCAPAHALLAYAHAYGVFVLGLDADAAARRAREHAEKALAIDDNDAFIHAMAANAFSICGEHELARDHSERAIELNPNELYAVSARGFVLTNAGDPAAAMEWLAGAQRLVPHASDSTLFEDMFDCLFHMAEYGGAIELFQRWRSPQFHMYLYLAATYGLLDRFVEARAAIADFESKRPPNYSIGNLLAAEKRIRRRQSDYDRLVAGLRKAGMAI
jgi:TolB-like protein/Tfp pilus assembly protein PilF